MKYRARQQACENTLLHSPTAVSMAYLKLFGTVEAHVQTHLIYLQTASLLLAAAGIPVWLKHGNRAVLQVKAAAGYVS